MTLTFFFPTFNAKQKPRLGREAAATRGLSGGRQRPPGRERQGVLSPAARWLALLFQLLHQRGRSGAGEAEARPEPELQRRQNEQRAPLLWDGRDGRGLRGKRGTPASQQTGGEVKDRQGVPVSLQHPKLCELGSEFHPGRG